jgi:hypothetical protein
MIWAETVHVMAGEDVTRWGEITRMPIDEFFFKLNFLNKLAKKRHIEMKNASK